MAIAAIPSPRPVNPSASVVVAATLTGAPRMPREQRLGLGAPGRELRAVADDLQRDVADGEPRLADATERLGEEHLAVRALEPRIAGAEDGPDVAESRGREQRVADGVARGVAVAVPREAALPRPVQSGEPERGVRVVGEGVHVDAGADPRQGDAPRATRAGGARSGDGVPRPATARGIRRRHASGHRRLGATQVAGQRDLEGPRVARHRVDGHARGGRERRVIRVLALGHRVGVHERGPREPLRGLHGRELRAVDGLEHATVGRRRA